MPETLARLFRHTIANSVKGIAIICNTSRQNPDDAEGYVQKEVIYHIKQKRADEVGIPIKKIISDQFGKIFKIVVVCVQIWSPEAFETTRHGPTFRSKSEEF